MLLKCPLTLLQVNRTVALNQRGIQLEWEPIVFSRCRVATGRDRQLCRDCRGQKKLVSTWGGRQVTGESAQLGLRTLDLVSASASFPGGIRQRWTGVVKLSGSETKTKPLWGCRFLCIFITLLSINTDCAYAHDVFRDLLTFIYRLSLNLFWG